MGKGGAFGACGGWGEGAVVEGAKSGWVEEVEGRGFGAWDRETLTKNALTEEQHLKKETKEARRREFAIQTGVSLVLFLSLWMVRGRALGLI